jgi:hypothetical protein
MRKQEQDKGLTFGFAKGLPFLTICKPDRDTGRIACIEEY